MNRELVSTIEQEVDPLGELRRYVTDQVITRENVGKHAREMVDELDRVWHNEGGCAVSVYELADYIDWLIDEQQA